jgi:phosphatidylinositol-3-phosphatase
VSALARLAALALAALPLFSAQAQAALPPIHHVYVIVLENESASTTFGPGSPAPYLSKTLRSRGAYVPNYYGIGHFSLDNYVAMISGQAPNVDTQADCQTYANFPAQTTRRADGQVRGSGCIYPTGTPTIAGQLTTAGLTWRDYNDGMGADPIRESSVCAHPAVNAKDGTQIATATDQYATRHNPFMYFHSIIDNTTLCDTHVVNLDALPQDLANPSPPNYVFITPSLCNDGHDANCANGGPGGLGQADKFLHTWVPRITGSSAYKRGGGLLIVTFDEAENSDSTACCGEIPGPGAPQPGLNGPGGGDTGAVVLSPYVKPRTVTRVAYNHYTMLRSVEDLFGLKHIGYAQLPGERSFGSDIFACAPATAPVVNRRRLPANSEIERVLLTRRAGQVKLRLLSVGNSALRVTVHAAHGRVTMIKRTLAPCRTYTLGLPGGTGHTVTVSASADGGAQTVRFRY